MHADAGNARASKEDLPGTALKHKDTAVAMTTGSASTLPSRYGSIARNGDVLISMAFMAIYTLSLFALQYPYVGLMILLIGTALYFAQSILAMSAERHVVAFTILILYLLTWGWLTGGFYFSSLANPQFAGGEGRVFMAYLPIFMLFALPQNLFTPVMVNRLIRGLLLLLITFVPLAAIGVMDSLTGSHHASGYLSATCFSIFMMLYIEQRRPWQLLGILVCILLLMFSNSRTSLAAITLAYMVYYRTRLLRPRILIGTGFAVIVSVAIWSQVDPATFERVSKLFNPALLTQMNNRFIMAANVTNLDQLADISHGGVDYNVITRVILWGKAVVMFAKSPIFGVGTFRFNDTDLSFVNILPGLTIAQSPAQSLSVATAHNSYFQALAEGGIVGLGLYLMPWLMMMRTLAKYKPRSSFTLGMRNAGMISILFLFFGALTGHLLAAPSITFWVLLVVTLALRLREWDAHLAGQEMHKKAIGAAIAQPA